jgi:hypothetical protein
MERPNGSLAAAIPPTDPRRSQDAQDCRGPESGGQSTSLGSVVSSPRFLLRMVMVVAVLGQFAGECVGQTIDDFGGGTPRWQLVGSDCQARLTRQTMVLHGGRDGRGCEQVELSLGSGTKAWLCYPLSPAPVIDDCAARLWVKASGTGLQLAVRVRFPHATDRSTGQPLEALLRGDDSNLAATWQQLSVDGFSRKLNLQQAILREQFGSSLDLSDPFIDGLMLNAYTGPGSIAVTVDDLLLEGFIPLASFSSATGRGDRQAIAALGPAAPGRPPVFTRALEWRGESLELIRSLGFTAAVMGSPPTPMQLEEAHRVGLQLIAPMAVDQVQRESYRGIVAAYYLGSSLDRGQLRWASLQRQAMATHRDAADQRPLLAAPAEAYRAFANVADGLVIDVPPPLRGLDPDAERQWVDSKLGEAGNPSNFYIGITTDPPEGLRRQLDGAARVLGIPAVWDYGWQAMWLQAFRAIQVAPRGLWFRSSTPLDSGRPEDQRRMAALRLINRQLQALEPLLIGASVGNRLPVHGGRYRAGELINGGVRLVVCCSGDSTAQGWPLGGDGRVIEIDFPSSNGLIPIRLTNAIAERLQPSEQDGSHETGIVAPDLVEFIVLAGDPSTVGSIGQRLSAAAQDSALDRWQLASESFSLLRANWQLASTQQRIDPQLSIETDSQFILRSLGDGEQLYRSGRIHDAARQIRRADSRIMRLQAMLSDSLQPREGASTSFPPTMVQGGTSIALATQRLWSLPWREVMVPDGGFEQPAQLLGNGWREDRRLEDRVGISVGPSDVVRSGNHSLRIATWALDGTTLADGYAGTAVRLRSPPIGAATRRWVRIDVEVQVPKGFEGINRGLLVYDNMGGAELGTLVGPNTQWRTVTLFRFTDGQQPLRIVFEAVGGGVAQIDNLRVAELIP